MKKNLLISGALYCGLLFAGAATLSSCSDDKNEPSDNTQVIVDSKNIDYSSENANGWHNYSVKVADLLSRDAADLYSSWTESYEGGASYASAFRAGNGFGYTSFLNCIEEIIDGCADIANEVGEAKIGDPYDLYQSNKLEEALYAVESWYSWHSREDYANNIYSVRNSYFGSLDGTVNENSMAALVGKLDPTLDKSVRDAINAAASAILAIPQPFRNNINSAEARSAMDVCADLEQVLTRKLKPFFAELSSSYDAQLGDIVANYVDGVVLPTYSQLKERTAALATAVKNLSNNRTNAAFEAACEAWLSAREPWERSEAFLFGPVDALGLDPNMDSWPLDQDAIVNHLKSGNFSDLEWGDGDDDDTVEAAQNIRGFHTLEFLLFKDGKPRKVNN
ncbi:MAG: peptidase M75 [Muribaculaceae bacterium]|nr:peptidase M75 [Muribaculaceae bacterium]